MRQRHRPSSDRAPVTYDPVQEGTPLLALLLFAGGFALGLFFGWLLHRERVERALYEDVVRARDRATSTLAETSARLELANRDSVRLREQLTDAQHGLIERDTTIARMRREAEAGVPPTGAAEADAPLAGDGFEEADVAEEADVTEEVVPTGELPIGAGAPDPEDELVEEAEEDLELVDGPDDGVGRIVAGPDAAGAAAEDEPEAAAEDEPEVAADEEPDGLDEAELEVVDEPDGEDATAGVGEAEVDVGPGPAQAADRAAVVDAEQPPEADRSDELAPGDDEVEDDDELVAAGNWYDREPIVDEAPDTDADADSGIGTPLVLEGDADDLRRIAGVGAALERALHSEGITTYRQLAQLDDRAIRELGDRHPRLVTRLRRDDWVAQARRLHEDTHGTSL